MARLAALVVLLSMATGCLPVMWRGGSLANRIAGCQNPRPYYLGAPAPSQAQIERCEAEEAQHYQDCYECEIEAGDAVSGGSSNGAVKRVKRLVQVCMQIRGYASSNSECSIP